MQFKTCSCDGGWYNKLKFESVGVNRMNATDRIADFSMIWKQVSQVFPYFDRQTIDWDMAYRVYLPRIMQAENEREFHLLLAEFMNLLGDGHTDYQFPKALLDANGYLPFAIRMVGEQYCVNEVHPEYAEHCGSVLREINGIPLSDLLQKVKKYSYHRDNYISRYRLHQILPFFLSTKGNIAGCSSGAFCFDLLAAKPETVVTVPTQSPEDYQAVETPKLDIRSYAGGILYIRLDDFQYSEAAAEIGAAIERMPGLKGVLLDLRENIGGMTKYGAQVAELFISGVFHGCKKHTRSMTGVGVSSASQLMLWSEKAREKWLLSGVTSREEIEESLRYVSNTHFDSYVDSYGTETHTARFSGPCVILSSRHTVSAAEDFIAMFRSSQRATVVGTETCGTTGTPLLQKLSCGGRIRVCSVGYRLLDDTEFIGCGIKPDVFCEPTVDEFQNGMDRVLAEGLRELREQS